VSDIVHRIRTVASGPLRDEIRRQGRIENRSPLISRVCPVFTACGCRDVRQQIAGEWLRLTPMIGEDLIFDLPIDHGHALAHPQIVEPGWRLKALDPDFLIGSIVEKRPPAGAVAAAHALKAMRGSEKGVSARSVPDYTPALSTMCRRPW
jgi:hypothetical protein